MQRLYDTLRRRKEVLQPREAGKLGVYVCGPTVYDMAHIGHARAYVAFDVILRWLRRSYELTYVRNYTDIDDKIIARAQERGVDSGELARQYADEFLADMDALGVARPDVEPRVTQHVEDIHTIIAELIEKGHAYAAGGDVYFAVRSFEGYGKLSGRSVDDMEAGSRVDPGEHKRDPLDFALWKGARPGEPSWESPWGPGRPGWHIECSAMSRCHLGEQFDIHGGGKDLIFPHHENEIAQSEAANGVVYAKHWMHNGFVNVDDEKMSKSLGNFFTIREVLQRYDPQTLRSFLLSVHYRSPISFSDQGLDEAEARMKYCYETLARMQAREVEAEGEVDDRFDPLRERFVEAMEDDFNTAKVVADLSEVFKAINEAVDRPEGAPVLRAARRLLDEIGPVLGLFHEAPTTVLERMAERKQAEHGVDAAAIDALIQERLDARKARDFARADEIRDQLGAQGVVLKDNPDGTTGWELA